MHHSKPVGAWLLLRLRRSDRYSGLRGWFDTERKLRVDVEDLVRDVEDRVKLVSSGAAQLIPSATGDTTLFDQFLELRRVIQSDGVLCEAEARSRVAKLNEVFRNARTSIQALATPVDPVARGAVRDPSVTRGGDGDLVRFRGEPSVDVKVRD